MRRIKVLLHDRNASTDGYVANLHCGEGDNDIPCIFKVAGNKWTSWRESMDSLCEQSRMFAKKVRRISMGAVSIDIYVNIDSSFGSTSLDCTTSALMVFMVLRELYGSPFLELNLLFYSNESHEWVPANFQYVLEMSKERGFVLPRSMNERYY